MSVWKVHRVTQDLYAVLAGGDGLAPVHIRPPPHSLRSELKNMK